MAGRNAKNYTKACIVSCCQSRSDTDPTKVFVRVPRTMPRRKQWFKAIRRKITDYSMNTEVYCCEDHFDLPNDMANYLKYTMIKCNMVMKEDAIPHKFDWSSNIESNENDVEKILDDETSMTSASETSDTGDEEEEDSNKSVTDDRNPTEIITLPILNPLETKNQLKNPFKILQPFQGKRIVDFIYLLQQFKDISMHDADEGCNANFLHPISEHLDGFYSKMTLHCSNCNKCFIVSLNKYSSESNINKTFLKALDETGLDFAPTKKLFEELEVPGWTETKYKEERNKKEVNFGKPNCLNNEEEIAEIVKSVPENNLPDPICVLNNVRSQESIKYKVAIPRVRQQIIHKPVKMAPKVILPKPSTKPQYILHQILPPSNFSQPNIKPKVVARPIVTNFEFPNSVTHSRPQKRVNDDYLVESVDEPNKRFCDDIVKEEHIIHVKDEFC